ncbi:MAG: hypothetical protein KDK34_10135 [Leptospiraceae bacterium]|nr:hypothetical protein [Leptospiraceae bacterium]
MSEIKRIILYKHGMGYFERLSRVSGNQSIELEFKKGDMNDVLKSLSVLDLDGGVIASISCDAIRSVSEELDEIALDLPTEDVLSGLLGALRGIRLRITPAGQSNPVEGEIIGLETKPVAAGDGQVDQKRLVLLCTDGGLRNFDLFELNDITILDEKPRRDVSKLLDTLQYWKQKDLKKLTVFTHGDGERRVQFNYTVPVPVWKTSYRVLLRKDNEPLLQGWAHVDNTGQEDWDGVSLSLVAGLPVSFIHDLYSPRRRRRPIIEVEEDAAYGAPIVQQGIASGEEIDALLSGLNEADELNAPTPPPAASSRGPRLRKAKAMAPPEAEIADLKLESLDDAFAQSAEVARHKIEMADLYVYAIEHPVTVRRGQSALVPILSTGFGGRQVALYNQNIRVNNPMTALEFENTTGLVLEGGPITVYQAGEYLGEAMLDTLKEGQKSLLPFAVELGCRVTIDHKSRKRGVFRCEIKNGVIHFKSRLEKNTIYIFNNQGGRKELEMYLDHPFEAGWDMAQSMPEPVEKTEDYYRYRFSVAAGVVHKFEAIEYGESRQSVQVVQLTDQQLLHYISMDYLNKEVAHKLKDFMALKHELEDVVRELESIEKDIKKIFENQTRIRENLKALGDRPEERELRTRYLDQWKQDENKLKEREDRARTQEEEKKILQTKRNALLNDISYAADFSE